ncbi:hypothetical protein CLOM621_08508 [Clostridium sp. M62/1]|nr:hypothetical protein CLOM621_08508 [Clostridium sp. M62/1]
MIISMEDSVSDLSLFAPLASPAAKKHRIYRYEPYGLYLKIFHWRCILRRLYNNDRVFL